MKQNLILLILWILCLSTDMDSSIAKASGGGGQDTSGGGGAVSTSEDVEAAAKAAFVKIPLTIQRLNLYIAAQQVLKDEETDASLEYFKETFSQQADGSAYEDYYLGFTLDEVYNILKNLNLNNYLFAIHQFSTAIDSAGPFANEKVFLDIQDGPCLVDGIHKEASATRAKNARLGTGTICISRTLLTRHSPNRLNQEISALLMHEFAHLCGATEDVADKLGKFIAKFPVAPLTWEKETRDEHKIRVSNEGRILTDFLDSMQQLSFSYQRKIFQQESDVRFCEKFTEAKMLGMQIIKGKKSANPDQMTLVLPAYFFPKHTIPFFEKYRECAAFSSIEKFEELGWDILKIQLHAARVSESILNFEMDLFGYGSLSYESAKWLPHYTWTDLEFALLSTQSKHTKSNQTKVHCDFYSESDSTTPRLIRKINPTPRDTKSIYNLALNIDEHGTLYVSEKNSVYYFSFFEILHVNDAEQQYLFVNKNNYNWWGPSLFLMDENGDSLNGNFTSFNLAKGFRERTRLEWYNGAYLDCYLE